MQFYKLTTMCLHDKCNFSLVYSYELPLVSSAVNKKMEISKATISSRQDITTNATNMEIVNDSDSDEF